MRIIALSALIATALAHPSLAGDSVTSVVLAVDAEHRVLALSDRSFMIVDEDVDLAQIQPGMKVTLDAALNEEDGYAAATSVTPTK